ncbi:MAG: undecaprenyldiphospho-muramoylpentapeptide beta-N-acetylglucosaminyltransferase [Desulfobulbus sp.]|nr:undecaprenyldiphospho-muramoylpentapeptide beta-N-acetylglucosaminyltransferase [Desulfobulbus sp.]
MRLIVAGGGTGGHLFPGIAVANAMREKISTTQVLFIGTSRLLDQQTLANLGYELAALECGGVKGLGLKTRIRNLLQMPGAVFEARRLLRRFQPDLVLGVGGYVTGPVLLAARSLGVPIAIHEQNSVPGMANRLAGKLADRVFISLPCKPEFAPEKTLQTGNPVRGEILAAAATPSDQSTPPTLLVLGGSQGAHRVNLLMLEAMEILAGQQVQVNLIHQTGGADEDLVRQGYERIGIQAEVSAFIQDMAAVYRRADLAVSRAGATTLAELAVMGLPALLIPYPYAADDHQTTNGQYYEKGHGCKVLREATLSGEILAQTISEYLQNTKELHNMSANMKTMAMPEATTRIVDECLRLAAHKEQH